MARWLLSSSFPAGVGVGRWQQQVGDDGLSGEEIVATSDGVVVGSCSGDGGGDGCGGWLGKTMI